MYQCYEDCGNTKCGAIRYQRGQKTYELFSKQAEKTPDYLALVFRDKKITYRQLDRMSDALDHRIREKGIRRNDVVPIVTERRWHVIVAMFGVLKGRRLHVCSPRLSGFSSICRPDSDIFITANFP
ncbi:MAG: AMP-binding protein [Lachnospiraceae bacterium]|nr:AMP-binding protein [Lachnospiraceae bacterium]